MGANSRMEAVMSEFKIKTVLLGNLAGEIKICTLEELLPYGFDL